MFLGTPHSGSDLTSLALVLSSLVSLSMVGSPNVSNLRILEKDSEVLAGIQDSFNSAMEKRKREGNPIHIHCCIEEYPVSGLGRVGISLLYPRLWICFTDPPVASRGTWVSTLSRLSHGMQYSSKSHGHGEIPTIL